MRKCLRISRVYLSSKRKTVWREKHRKSRNAFVKIVVMSENKH